jgi:hypothetical protein
LAYIPDQLLKCVVFIGYKNQHNEYRFAGSSFWISRHGPDDLKEEYRLAYLATAAHVITKIKQESADGRVWLRINTKSGGQEWYETPVACWTTHPDPSVDLAVLKIGIAQQWDHIAWPLEACVFIEQLDTIDTGDRKVELGDELFFAGLFYPHKGEKKNIPIVRVGNVSALRNEPVMNRDGVPMDLYLVDSRSIGGLSGSPVFIDILTAKRTLPPTWGHMSAAYPPNSPSRFKLFGIIHGHFGNDVEPDAAADDGKETIKVNMGIAMVIPEEKLTDVIGQFMNEEELEIAERRNAKRALVVPDAAPNTTFRVTNIEF